MQGHYTYCSYPPGIRGAGSYAGQVLKQSLDLVVLQTTRFEVAQCVSSESPPRVELRLASRDTGGQM